MKIYSKEWFMLYIDEFESLYFKNRRRINGITIPDDKRTLQDVEQKACEYEKSGKVDLWIAAWKMGRLNYDGEVVKKSDNVILNGYGKEICAKELCEYLKNIDSEHIFELIEKCDYEQAYQDLVDTAPKNFGTVYIISLMHFISKGKIPIYDKFAHTAVKAIYSRVNPNMIYVGNPPGKNETRKATNLLREYMWLLNEVFGTASINR